MKQVILTSFLLVTTISYSQRSTQISLAVTNNNSAIPFSKFSGLFKTPFHPGVEVGYGFNWKIKKKHHWFQEFKLGYFYHRFVQHGIPLYTQFGYRYRFANRWHSNAALGAGYMHSIPASAKLKLNENGEYENNKGAGRMQFIINLSIGAGFVINPSAKKPVTLFINYQQQLQTPFVKSYVPLLPYNSLSIGAGIPLKPKQTL